MKKFKISDNEFSNMFLCTYTLTTKYCLSSYTLLIKVSDIHALKLFIYRLNM